MPLSLSIMIICTRLWLTDAFISLMDRHNPGGHERKIVQKLQNAEAKQKAANGAANGTANGTTADK